MKKNISIMLVCTLVLALCVLTGGCDPFEKTDVQKQQIVARNLEQAQPTPTDIDYSLERYNLIRRSYWVNGQREKALSLPCPVEKPLGYVFLFLEGVGVVGNYVVDGKVSSLNSFLTPDSEYYSAQGRRIDWIADVDGSYGNNDNGIFFFTPDGKYIEWTGVYLYSDIPHIVKNPILKIKEGK